MSSPHMIMLTCACVKRQVVYHIPVTKLGGVGDVSALDYRGFVKTLINFVLSDIGVYLFLL